MLKFINETIIFILGIIFMFFIFFENPAYLVGFNENLGLPCWNNEISKIVGVCIIALGIMSWLFCSINFIIIGDGTPLPVAPPSKLVVKGIYRYSRNPIYIAFTAVLFGIFLINGHLLLLLHVFFCFIIIHLYIILWEEPKLSLRFGEKYKRYLREVPRWLPLWAGTKS